MLSLDRPLPTVGVPKAAIELRQLRVLLRHTEPLVEQAAIAD
jgi:hypothetical protein